MNIYKVKWGENNETVIINDNIHMPYPCEYHRWEPVQEWIDEGNSIEPADPPIDSTKEDALQFSDKTFVRVLEDIINVLVSKGAISLADLPQEAQDKLQERINIRNS